MTTLTSTALLLCSISTCCCVWGLESSTVEVQSGQSVTLLCSNFSSGITSISWYRAVRRSTLSRMSTISSSLESKSNKDGFEDGRFNVTSNSSHIFLTISPVNSSDTGFYFCGYESSMGLILKNSTYLDVHEVDTEGTDRLLVPVLAGSVVVLILLIIGLAVKNKALQKAQDQERPGQTESSPLNILSTMRLCISNPSPVRQQVSQRRRCRRTLRLNGQDKPRTQSDPECFF